MNRLIAVLSVASVVVLSHCSPAFAHHADGVPHLHFIDQCRDSFAGVYGEGTDCAREIGYGTGTYATAKRMRPLEWYAWSNSEGRVHVLLSINLSETRVQRLAAIETPGSGVLWDSMNAGDCGDAATWIGTGYRICAASLASLEVVPDASLECDGTPVTPDEVLENIARQLNSVPFLRGCCVTKRFDED